MDLLKAKEAIVTTVDATFRHAHFKSRPMFSKINYLKGLADKPVRDPKAVAERISLVRYALEERNPDLAAAALEVLFRQAAFVLHDSNARTDSFDVFMDFWEKADETLKEKLHPYAHFFAACNTARAAQISIEMTKDAVLNGMPSAYEGLRSLTIRDDAVAQVCLNTIRGGIAARHYTNGASVIEAFASLAHACKPDDQTYIFNWIKEKNEPRLDEVEMRLASHKVISSLSHHAPHLPVDEMLSLVERDLKSGPRIIGDSAFGVLADVMRHKGKSVAEKTYPLLRSAMTDEGDMMSGASAKCSFFANPPAIDHPDMASFLLDRAGDLFKKSYIEEGRDAVGKYILKTLKESKAPYAELSDGTIENVIAVAQRDENPEVRKIAVSIANLIVEQAPSRITEDMEAKLYASVFDRGTTVKTEASRSIIARLVARRQSLPVPKQ